MQPLFSQDYTLTTNAYDYRNNLSMTGILDLCQNSAGRHAPRLGADKESLATRGLMWVIARNELRFESFPLLPTEVRVTTWPTPPTRFYFDRHYKVINNENGEVIAHGRGRWVLIDIKSRKMADSTRFTFPLTTFHGENNFPDDFPRVSKSVEVVGAHTVVASDLDENNHLNNSKYANIIFDFLPLQENERIKNVVINYSNEAYLGDKITISRIITKDTYYISGAIGEKGIFSSKVEVILC